ncbi:HesA/MoeB/ThiF family protein [Aliiruegeria lutimaris]|uniref:Molybdopterin-synthase adenylyltransferase n=1 Tax=Aliiruegeria lutimaris TaxID=571298 RepID=A0A1G8QJ29_9RHOB|nr:molybdopterin-synthase adenylyltransferase MoeB [Aliiruegeria lutimaris]SDJ04717.1 Molybdopterin or thiamine biosynthesis adenylyltransferase [Aliiruegeria lutimaris]
MILVLALAAVLWGVGHAMGASGRVRWTMIAFLYAVVVLEQLVLPDGHPLREATGESPAFWLLLGGFGVLVALYFKGVNWLKARAQPVEAVPVAKPGSFAEGELERYARHIVLRELGGPGQKKLKQSRVLVVGAGGLGSPALFYLATSGVGTIGVIDGDTVDGSNLQRQILHREEDIGTPKVFSAMRAMKARNPFVEVKPYHRELTEEIARDLIAEYDLVLDGTDNFDTRYLVNRAAVACGVPLVSGALSQWEGQISVFDPANGAPCYQCVFPQAPAPELAPSCAAAGVLGPLPGVVGTMMAVEAVKVLSGAGEPLRGRMLIYDALYAETRQFMLSQRPDCPICTG